MESEQGMSDKALDNMLHDMLVYAFCQGNWGEKRVPVRGNLLLIGASRRMWN